jgi:hypothetical protein
VFDVVMVVRPVVHHVVMMVHPVVTMMMHHVVVMVMMMATMVLGRGESRAGGSEGDNHRGGDEQLLIHSLRP